MVKVSFNSALAQKEAAKKEEENSQVLILPPDAKVRAAGGPTLRGRPGGAGRCAALRCARRGCPGKGARRGRCRALYAPCPRRWPAGGLEEAARPCAPPPHRLTLLKWLTGSELLGSASPGSGDLCCGSIFLFARSGVFVGVLFWRFFFLLAAWTAATSALRAGCTPAPAASGCAGLCGEGGSCLRSPRRYPSRPPGGARLLLASSRSPDAPGQGSARRVKLGIRPRLCRSVFAEPGACVLRGSSPRNLGWLK